MNIVYRGMPCSGWIQNCTISFYPSIKTLVRLNHASLSRLLYPLSMMRMARKLPKLSFAELDPDQVPEPYQSLLVHDGDMTSRLEAYHEAKLVVSSLRSSSDGKSYFREVLLKTQESDHAVEYGAIEIALQHLPDELRPLVVEAKQPLGLLNDHRIPYSSAPRAFLKSFRMVPLLKPLEPLNLMNYLVAAMKSLVLMVMLLPELLKFLPPLDEN